MKNRIIIIGLLLCMVIFAGCNDEFGKKLLGPDETVAPTKAIDRVLVFLNTTNEDDIASGSVITANPIDVIFSAVAPIGEVREITTSAKLDAKSVKNQTFTVNVLEDEALLAKYKEDNGYRVKFLPEGAYRLLTDLISVENSSTVAITQSIVKVINSSAMELNQDYLLALNLEPEDGFVMQPENKILYLHLKRKGGSGEMEGAVDLKPLPGDNTLASDKVDRGIVRNNMYYEIKGDAFVGLNACTIEGLIYVDRFKDEADRESATLAGISSVWGYEGNGKSPFLLRFGDAGLAPNKLQLVLDDTKKYLIPYTFKEKNWYHIAMTFNGEFVKVYVNGREKLSFVKATKGISLGGVYFHVGYSFNNWRGFNGMMSEVRVWKTVRTLTQLKANALEVLKLSEEKNDLIAYWKMNKVKEGSTTQVSDDSGNGRDLTVKRQGASNSSIIPKVVINNNVDINLR